MQSSVSLWVGGPWRIPAWWIGGKRVSGAVGQVAFFPPTEFCPLLGYDWGLGTAQVLWAGASCWEWMGSRNWAALLDRWCTGMSARGCFWEAGDGPSERLLFPVGLVLYVTLLLTWAEELMKWWVPSVSRREWCLEDFAFVLSLGLTWGENVWL